ncbi:Procollagen-proline dioxygenase [Bertholletia excelsa]
MGTRLEVLLLLAFTSLFLTNCAEGGRKELRTKEVHQANAIQLGHPIRSNRLDPSRVVQLSWQPRVFLYRGFLSEEESDGLITRAKRKEEKSIGNGGDLGKVGKNNLLQNSDIYLSMDDDLEAKVEEKISTWTFLPKENSSPLQILHFGLEDAKGKYDYFGNKSRLVLNEPLTATVVLYLSNVSQGGQILFPEAKLDNSQPKSNIWSDCGKSSHMLRPTKGNAILFFNSHLNASPDHNSNHHRCPVLDEDMWCATKFFHVKAVTRRKVHLQTEDGDCTDEDESCPRWAAIGECQRNPVFMVGTPDYYGTCRKSCNACKW